MNEFICWKGSDFFPANSQQHDTSSDGKSAPPTPIAIFCSGLSFNAAIKSGALTTTFASRASSRLNGSGFEDPVCCPMIVNHCDLGAQNAFVDGFGFF